MTPPKPTPTATVNCPACLGRGQHILWEIIFPDIRQGRDRRPGQVAWWHAFSRHEHGTVFKKMACWCCHGTRSVEVPREELRERHNLPPLPPEPTPGDGSEGDWGDVEDVDWFGEAPLVWRLGEA